MDEKKGGLQPDGSWLLIENFDPPYKMLEKKIEKKDESKFEFKRNEKNRVEAVYEDGQVNEIGVLGDFAGFTDGFPYTPEEYLTYGLSPKEAEALLNGKSGRDRLIEFEGRKGYESLIKEGAIKDPTYK